MYLARASSEPSSGDGTTMDVHPVGTGLRASPRGGALVDAREALRVDTRAARRPPPVLADVPAGVSSAVAVLSPPVRLPTGVSVGAQHLRARLRMPVNTK
eukprot:6214429-Pleurochrysis_carterae.AAC.2